MLTTKNIYSYVQMMPKGLGTWEKFLLPFPQACVATLMQQTYKQIYVHSKLVPLVWNKETKFERGAFTMHLFMLWLDMIEVWHKQDLIRIIYFLFLF